MYFRNDAKFDFMTYLNFSSPLCSSNLTSLSFFPKKLVKELYCCCSKGNITKNGPYGWVTAFQCESSL
jgi:hypothetical protein